MAGNEIQLRRGRKKMKPTRGEGTRKSINCFPVGNTEHIIKVKGATGHIKKGNFETRRHEIGRSPVGRRFTALLLQATIEKVNDIFYFFTKYPIRRRREQKRMRGQ